MTSDERGLLAAVLESPDDDTPRLILADWYEENRRGVRARFIRTQIGLARLVAADQLDTDEYVAAMQAVATIPDLAFWDGVRQAGFPLAAGVMHPVDVRANEVLVRDVANQVSYIYRRGFIEHILAPVGWFRDHEAAFAGLPLVRLELALVGIAHQMQLRFKPPTIIGGWWTVECGITWGTERRGYSRQWMSRGAIMSELRDWLHERWTTRVSSTNRDLVEHWQRANGPHLASPFAPPP